MIALCLNPAEIMIARRLLRSVQWVTRIRAPRVCIRPPAPRPADYSGVVMPANIPMRDIGGHRQILSGNTPQNAADTVKPESTR